MIEVGIPSPVQWRVATRRHDWLDGAALHRLLVRWTEIGLIGPPDRFEAGDEDEAWTVREGETLTDAILRIPRNGGGGLSCRMRGAAPRPWWMSVVLSAFDEAQGRTNGYSMINLNLPRDHCDAEAARLLATFAQLHRPENCEYASIHPERQGETLRAHAYVPPLDIAPMFAGLLWANFLGPDIVAMFDREVIDKLDVAIRHWFDGGVMLAVSEDLVTIDGPEGERKLIALTQELRA